MQASRSVHSRDTHEHTQTFGYYSRRRSSIMVGVDPVGAIAGTSPRTPASPARSPTRVLRTNRPCRPRHGMCCAAGEGVCTYAPSEERGPRGTGLSEAPHAVRYKAMLRVIHPRAPKSHRVGGDPLARAGLAGFSYGPAPTCQQRLAPSPASAVPRAPCQKIGILPSIGYGHVGTSPRASWCKRFAPSPQGVRLGTENASSAGNERISHGHLLASCQSNTVRALTSRPTATVVMTGRQMAVTS